MGRPAAGADDSGWWPSEFSSSSLPGHFSTETVPRLLRESNWRLPGAEILSSVLLLRLAHKSGRICSLCGFPEYAEMPLICDLDHFSKCQRLLRIVSKQTCALSCCTNEHTISESTRQDSVTAGKQVRKGVLSYLHPVNMFVSFPLDSVHPGRKWAAWPNFGCVIHTERHRAPTSETCRSCKRIIGTLLQTIGATLRSFLAGAGSTTATAAIGCTFNLLVKIR